MNYLSFAVKDHHIYLEPMVKPHNSHVHFGISNILPDTISPPSNPSRRVFVSDLAGVGAAIAAGGLSAFFPTNAHAELNDWYNTLPPGFKTIIDTKGDKVLVDAYLKMIDRHNQENENKINGMLTQNGRLSDVYTGVIKNDTPFIEPAYWFAVSLYIYKYQTQGVSGMISRGGGKFNLPTNSPMFHWAQGINSYFKIIVSRNKKNNELQSSFNETSTFLLNAIFTASGRSESEVRPYSSDAGMNTPKIETVLREIMSFWDIQGPAILQARQRMDQISVELEGRISEDQRKKLDKDKFILEKRLQREKLSYEKEYDLTQQLKSLQQRLNGQVDSGKKEQLKSEMIGLRREYTNGLIVAWSSFFLDKYIKEKLSYNSAISSIIVIPLEKYIPQIRGNYFV